VTAALASRGAGDECDFPLNASHIKSPFCGVPLMCFGRR
jgi:hypothetical protein